MRKSSKSAMAYECNYCGHISSSFVTTVNYKHFCRIQTPGQPADKDCMSDYLNKESIAQQFTF